VTSNLEKGDGLVHCFVKNAGVLCEKKKKKKERKTFLAVWRLSGSVLSR